MLKNNLHFAFIGGTTGESHSHSLDMGAAKATMAMLGVDIGPARLPNGSLTVEQTRTLRSELEALGFFEWIHVNPRAGRS